MSETQETFISHLVELRDRLIRALVAILMVFVPLAFFSRELYALLAAPLLATLPAVVAVSVLLFFCGMAFAYFAFFPMVFGFMAAVAPEGVAWMTDIEKYLSFVMTMFLAFGVTFEVPIIVIVLARAGIVSVAQMREWRPYVIVGAFVIAAVFTPPDVISQFMMAVPMCLLFELGLLLADWLVKPAPEAQTS
ncbi:MAG: twin-arginine translocase subunit TatC [Rhodocyclaceae bacterium]|nr:twin-arginine translocase subunit TatC [Rhodocyclaceae bacterium]